MRLVYSRRQSARWPSVAVLFVFGMLLTPGQRTATAQDFYAEQMARERGHNTAQWAQIEGHLPDRLTSSPELLESQADILLARSFPEDANSYYNYALQNGGDPAGLLVKIGMTELDMRDVPAARAYFKRVLSIDHKHADAWNNLGVVEQINARLPFAIVNYERATKLDPLRAVFHANLAIAYLDHAEYASARREIATALRLDPAIFESEGDNAGPVARVISAQARLRLQFELARLYAQLKDEDRMVHALAAASEAGMDVRTAMRRDHVLAPYLDDARVIVLSRNSQLLRMLGEADPTQHQRASTGGS